MTGDTAAQVVSWFQDRSERAIQTQLAWVFLQGDVAYKLKREVDLGFVDFSTADKRLWALERELEFNRAAAPDVYRAIHTVTRGEGGGFVLGGPGEVVDHVLEMRRFDESQVLGVRPEALDGAMAEALGRQIAGFHTQATPRPGGGLTSMEFTVGSNAKLMRELAPELGAERVEQLVAMTEAELARRRPLLAARTRDGFARLCHGDLHLGNILVEDDRPILFDCIEFNDLLSDIDVQYDLAFLLMDLDFRHRREAAVRVLSAYLDEAARSFPPALWEGLAALPLMLAVRAGVRAHVTAHSGDAASARAYVDAGIAHLSPAPPILAAVGGLSGSGKSSVARAAAPRLGASPGAVILRTDEVRKRLLQVSPHERLGADGYAPAVTARVYDEMFADAGRLLRAGRAVVLDATFLDAPLRDRAEALAIEAGVPFHGAWLEAPGDVLRERVLGRTGDASDADLATLETQLGRNLGPLDWRRLDATQPPETTVKRWLTAEGI